MRLFTRYAARLKAKATGIPRRQWHSVAAGEALWFSLPCFMLLALAKLLPEPEQTVAFWMGAVTYLLGLGATQAFILVVHLKDYGERMKRIGD